MSVTLWRWALGTCMLLVLVLSLLPPSPQLPTTGWDKSNHVLAFAVLLHFSRSTAGLAITSSHSQDCSRTVA